MEEFDIKLYLQGPLASSRGATGERSLPRWYKSEQVYEVYSQPVWQYLDSLTQDVSRISTAPWVFL